MKRIFWWSLFGISGAGLAALWLGQSVFGQPDYRETLPLPAAPFVAAQPLNPAVKSSGARPGETPQVLNLTGAQLPDLRPVPKSAPPTPLPLPTSPMAPSPYAITQTSNSVPAVPLNVQPGRQQPSLSIEWNGPTSIRINQPMNCQILVRNMSNVPLHNVVVRHQLGQGVSCKGSEPQVAKDGGDLMWNLGTLAPEQTRRIDIVLVAPGRGVINCHATATFTAIAGHRVQVYEPQLVIKMRAPDKVIAGETVNLIYEITNPGDGITESIKVKTLLPEGLEHASGRRVIEFDAGNLPPKEMRRIQMPCVAKGAGTQHCQIDAVAEGNLSSKDAAQIEILTPKLAVALTGPRLRYLDRHAVYVVRVTNPGSAPATGVEVQEAIPAGFRFHQANNGGKYQESTRLVSWTVGDLQPGQSKDISVDLVPIETGEHRLIAQAKSARGLKSEVHTLTVVEGLPSLSIDVAHVDDPIEVGAETAFEIRVANTGTNTETNVQVVCTLPEQLEFKNAKCTTALKYRLEGRELIFEPLPRLAKKVDVIYRIQVRGIAPGDVRFKTRIRADGLKEPVSREESMRIYSDDTPQQPTAAKERDSFGSPRPNVPAPIAPTLPNPGVPPAPVVPAPVAPPVSVPAPYIPAPAPMTPVTSAPIPGPVPAPTGIPAPGPVPIPPLPALPPVGR